MTHVLYTSAVCNLMYEMVCTKPNLSRANLIVRRYMHDLRRGHWVIVKWILLYIKGIIDVGLVFKKDFIGKHECIRYVDSDYA